MRIALSTTSALLIMLTELAVAQTSIKIGVVGTFSGPTAMIGNDLRNGFELGLDHIDRKMAGKPIEVIYEDDQQKPEVAQQKTQKLIESNKVDFLVGYIWSNVLLASLKQVVDTETFMIITVAGASQVAGEQCSRYVFSTSWQSNQNPQAMGLYMNQRNVKSAYVLAPNYAAGKDVITGLKSTFKGQIVGEDYTRWPDQLDFSGELAKIRAVRPDAVFVFYPGAAGVQFLTQYSQSGLKGQIPLYTSFTIDELTLGLQKDLALGVPGVQAWVNDLQNDTNKRFVSDYKAKYRSSPSYYAAQSYDAASLINGAVVAVHGDTSRKEDMRMEMEKAAFKSVRGNFRFGNNHMPIQNFYLQDVVRDTDGNLTLRTVATIVENDRDRFHEKCLMK